MERRKRYVTPRSKKERVGCPTGLLDCCGNEIITGDFIRVKSYRYYDYVGPVLWNRHQQCYGVFSGLWYGNSNPYDPDSYGKFIAIPSDNGMRMELVPVSREDQNRG